MQSGTQLFPHSSIQVIGNYVVCIAQIQVLQFLTLECYDEPFGCECWYIDNVFYVYFGVTRRYSE